MILRLLRKTSQNRTLLMPSSLNQISWLTPGDCLLFATVLPLLLQAFQSLLQRSDCTVLQQRIHYPHTLLQFCKHKSAQQVIYKLDHLTLPHKVVVWIILRQLRGILNFPALQQMQIITRPHWQYISSSRKARASGWDFFNTAAAGGLSKLMPKP